jgi:hypothetical protein
MNIKKSFYLPIGFLLLFCACKDSLSTTYAGCCGESGLISQMGNVTVFVPNTFTPDFDGINDNIVIFTSGAIGTITEFKLKDKANNIVWQSGTTAINPNQGLTITTQELAKIPEGLLPYSFKITPTNGNAFVIQGAICKNTNKDTDCPSKNAKCTFSTQNNNGVLDKRFPSSEICE